VSDTPGDLSQPKSAPNDRAINGPFDVSEANAVRPYVDLGGVKIVPREGLHLRLEVEEGTKRVVAVGLDYAGSTLQVQPFAAPRSAGLWHEIRAQIADQIRRQGGTTHKFKIRDVLKPLSRSKGREVDSLRIVVLGGGITHVRQGPTPLE
jgi:hypothetical protein